MDVFEEDADELTLIQSEYKRIMENIEKDGFIEGIEEGKQKTVQAAFDKGYETAFNYFYKINLLKGIVSASMNKKDQIDQLKEINESLINLERTIMDDLVKDNKKDYSDSFNRSIDEIKNRLKQLNLIQNLDKILDLELA